MKKTISLLSAVLLLLSSVFTFTSCGSDRDLSKEEWKKAFDFPSLNEFSIDVDEEFTSTDSSGFNYKFSGKLTYSNGIITEKGVLDRNGETEDYNNTRNISALTYQDLVFSELSEFLVDWFGDYSSDMAYSKFAYSEDDKCYVCRTSENRESVEIKIYFSNKKISKIYCSLEQKYQNSEGNHSEKGQATFIFNY